MTKPKTFQYQIQYKDNTYRLIDWSKAEFKQVGEDMQAGFEVSILEDGVFSLVDIRAIVIIPELEPEPEQELGDENLTEWGFVDLETARWLQAQGIDVSKGGK